MFVHGGLSEDDKYLNDSHLLNLTSPMKWQKINIWVSDWPSLAYHTCCLVMPLEMRLNSKFSMYKLPELNEITKYRYSKVLIL